MNRYTLTYFDIRGRAEPIRLLLAYAGIAYEDRGLDSDAWAAQKPSSPLGQMPFFTEHTAQGDRTMPQTMAIIRHLARVHGLEGKNEDERVAADVASETAIDLRIAFAQLRFSPAWQDEGAKTKFAQETAPAHFARLAKLLGDREWFASSAPTYADLVVFDALDRQVVVWPSILENFPALASFKRRVESLETLAPYLRSRRAP